jgi:hypothetical protein
VERFGPRVVRSRATRGRPRVSAASLLPHPPLASPLPEEVAGESPGVSGEGGGEDSSPYCSGEGLSEVKAAASGGEAASTRSASGVRGCLPSSSAAGAARWRRVAVVAWWLLRHYPRQI